MSLPRQLVRFGCVGLAAMAVHLAVVALFVPLGVPPLVANPLGFVVAFQVSYAGHRSWTFGVRGGSRAYSRMLAVSISSFFVNEVLYALLLRFSSLDWRIALVLVLGVVAVVTFVASKCWVFTRKASTT